MELGVSDTYREIKKKNFIGISATFKEICTMRMCNVTTLQ